MANDADVVMTFTWFAIFFMTNCRFIQIIILPLQSNR